MLGPGVGFYNRGGIEMTRAGGRIVLVGLFEKPVISMLTR